MRPLIITLVLATTFVAGGLLDRLTYPIDPPIFYLQLPSVYMSNDGAVLFTNVKVESFTRRGLLILGPPNGN